MIAFLRRFIRLIFWWVVVIICIAFIGYIAWPLLSEKFYSLCTNQDWELCRGEWGVISDADRVQQTIEAKTTSFYDIAGTAVGDVLSDQWGKTTVTYTLDTETGVYTPTPVR